jgi:hypothetical protein
MLNYLKGVIPINKSKFTSARVNIAIYTLSIVLSCLVCYIAFKTLLTAKNYVPENSIHVSPLTGERIKPAFINNTPFEVTYTTSENTVSLDGISNAEIIYEYLDKSRVPYYKALFEKNPPIKSNPIVSIDSIQNRLLPKLNFIDSIDLPKDFTRSAGSIFVSLSYNLFSNFIYEDDTYHHYRDTYKDIDKSTSKEVAVSNVVIQFVKANIEISSPQVSGNGKGLLFRGGKVIDIKWDRQKSQPIKVIDEEGNPVSLIRGKTWWIIIHENSSVAYN